MRRRSLLEALAVGGLGLAVAPGALAVDDVAPRLVVVILRGGLDGLALAPPHGDPGYRSVRGGLALPAPGTEGGIVDLDGTFGLHPALAPLAPLYGQGELVVVHAASVPYDRRSHFDGQDVLENGTAIPFGERTGWLSRALALSEEAPAALAVGRTIPLLLRGPARAASADLTRRPRTDPWLQRVQQLYLDDPQLGPALEEGLEIQALLARHGAGASLGRRRSSLETELEGVAQLLGALDGPRTVVLEVGGWDTHTGQLTSLSRQLERLALGMIALKRASEPGVWRRTVVLVVTEFGRTVRPNGTGGSDHGVGGAALLLGGAVAGGRIVTDWPGLSEPRLLAGRDLRPTTDLRGVFKGVLHDHLGVPSGALEDTVFPGSGSIPRVGGLVRG